MRTWYVALILAFASTMATACGGNEDPFAPGDDDSTGDDDTSGSPDANPTGGGDAPPPHACAATPTRMIVYGDSITACSVIGGANDPDCASKKLFDYVKATYAPDLEYVNRAVGGARLQDLGGQIDGTPAGTGHALIVVYMGGNDLAPYIFQSDDAATQAWTDISADVDTYWEAAFAKFADTSKFPDGATVLMNTQYNPFDDCTAPPYNLSEVKNEILKMYNQKLVGIADAKGDAAVIVDQYLPYLGHGHHYNVDSCPHFATGKAPFMEDLIHANVAGNVLLADVMQGGADRLYGDSCVP